jgi:hypothetical protein
VVVLSLLGECRYVGGRTLPEPVLALGRAIVATVEDLVDQAAHDELVGLGHHAPSWSAWLVELARAYMRLDLRRLGRSRALLA